MAETMESQVIANLEKLGLDERLIYALIKKGIEKPTPIQQEAIPRILVSYCWLILNFYAF